MKIITCTFFILGLALASCKKEGCTDSAANNYDANAKKDDGSCVFDPQYNVKLHIHPRFKGGDLIAGQNYQDDFFNFFSLSRFDFYISNPVVYDSQNQEIWGLGQQYLFKLSENTFDLGKVSAASVDWKKISFEVGVPADLNTNAGANFKMPENYADSNALSQQIPSMFFDAENGYIFIALEGMSDTDDDGVPNTDINYYIGTNNLRSFVDVNLNMEVEGNDVDIYLEVFVNRLLENVFTKSELNTNSTSNLSLAQKIKNNVSFSFALGSGN